MLLRNKEGFANANPSLFLKSMIYKTMERNSLIIRLVYLSQAFFGDSDKLFGDKGQIHIFPVNNCHFSAVLFSNSENIYPFTIPVAVIQGIWYYCSA